MQHFKMSKAKRSTEKISSPKYADPGGGIPKNKVVRPSYLLILINSVN